MKYYLAVDIGASSGRHMIGFVENGKICLEEVYRFENTLCKADGLLCWDLDRLFGHIIAGMQACAQKGMIPVTMGIDTWAVDFVLLDEANHLVGPSVGYRDSRTRGMDKIAEAAVPFEELYARTGIQKQPFNTLYQLLALKQQQPEQLKRARHFLMIPDYFNFLLTGVMKNEYTNATSTALVNAHTKEWDGALLRRLGLPDGLFGSLSMPGESVGRLLPEIARQVGFDCTVMLPATHDTGSAFLAVPAVSENTVTISSGTWSLLGVELPKAITTPESAAANFTNEGGYDDRFRYLKNIMGLWMIQSIRRNCRNEYTFARLEEMARQEADFTAFVNVNDSSFLAPDNMIEAVQAVCRKTGQPVPQTLGQVMQCVYQSLAASYGSAIEELSKLTGKTFETVHIVGGGSKDGYLNQLTAKVTGLPVVAGPTEGTALGNVMAQMIAGGTFENLTAARAAVGRSFALQRYGVE